MSKNTQKDKRKSHFRAELCAMGEINIRGNKWELQAMMQAIVRRRGNASRKTLAKEKEGW